jgi:hypothetical protein
MKVGSHRWATVRVERSYRTAIRAKWLPNTNRISVSRLDGYERMYVDWDCNLDVGENYANAIQRFVKRMDWSGVWVVGSTDDGAVAVWKGHE